MDMTEPLSHPRADEAKGDSGTLQRGLAILRILAEAMTPLSSREIAEAVGLNDSTTHRLLQTLKDEGYVCRDESKRYHASPDALLPLSLYHPLHQLRREVSDTLRGLRDQLGMTSSLIVFVGIERLVLDISAAIDISPYYNTHLTAPLHASASGKILLMGMPRQRQTQLLGAPPYQSYTQHTITELEPFLEELELTRSRGFASNLDENFVGLCAAAAPVYAMGREGPVACLTVAGASEKFQGERLPEVGRVLRERADLIAVASPSVRAVRNMFHRFG